MALRIEDYALIGDTHTAALVGLDGSIDWLCTPDFSSPACFAALLGKPEHGRWLIAPEAEPRRTRRRYRDGSLVLETDFETDEGAVTLVDCMPQGDGCVDLVRMVLGRRGRVPMRMQLVVRFDYGSIVPWVRRLDDTLSFVGGPDALELRAPVELRGEDYTTVARFTVSEGERVFFALTWHPSNEPPPAPRDPERAIEETDRWWREWSGRCVCEGPWTEDVRRSLITLKALTFAPTGGIVAAASTSLPEWIGGGRNWDYRLCWLRDATFTLYALSIAGYQEEASAWREWLLRAVAGKPSDLQILYGLRGERHLTEQVIPWLPGYADSNPVRIGNAAIGQFQLDVYGELMDALHLARRAPGMEPEEAAWEVQRVILDFLESAWSRPDRGIWEVRGPQRHFTHSKVMAWVAFDRAVKGVERFGLEGPLDRWKAIRGKIHDEVCRRGYNGEIDSFVQAYDTDRLDAGLLMIPLVGFLPPDDPRVQGTVRRIERCLTTDGLVRRYEPDEKIDGLEGGEGVFLACSFWLADNLAMMGRRDEARELFERLRGLGNDVGLFSEQYDPETGRMLGNFPQAFSHVALVNTARNLVRTGGPAEHRCEKEAARSA